MGSSLLDRLAIVLVLTAAGVLLGGCAAAPALGPFGALKEANTRAQVERQASRDPFPSPGDVGLK